MFEDALVESRHLIRSRATRWTTLGSFALQAAIAALLLIVPLTRTELLPNLTNAPRLELPPITTPPPPIHIQQALASAASTAASLPVQAVATVASGRSLTDILHSTGNDDPTPSTLGTNLCMSSNCSGTGPGSLLSSIPGSSAPAVVRATPTDSGPHKISSGVSQGLLVEPIRPVYPAIARATQTSGAVIIAAVISKTGHIESLHVISGPSMLRQAALDAVQAARYRPYTLNNQPVEVETTITVNFLLSN